MLPAANVTITNTSVEMISACRVILEALGVKYTLFLPDGTPVRATVNLKMKQANKLMNKKEAEGAVEDVGTSPCGIEGCVAPGTGACDRAIVRIVGEVVVPGDLRQDLFY